jgi:hypothetical protein
VPPSRSISALTALNDSVFPSISDTTLKSYRIAGSNSRMGAYFPVPFFSSLRRTLLVAGSSSGRGINLGSAGPSVTILLAVTRAADKWKTIVSKKVLISTRSSARGHQGIKRLQYSGRAAKHSKYRTCSRDLNQHLDCSALRTDRMPHLQ